MTETKHATQDAALKLNIVVDRFLKGYGGYFELSIAQENFAKALEKQEMPQNGLIEKEWET